jgi:hypothetical protein
LAQPAATDGPAGEFFGKGPPCIDVTFLAHFPPCLPQQDEIRIGLNNLVIQTPAGPIASPHAPPASQRMPQQHQACQGHTGKTFP